MADLTDLQSAQTVKIAGANPSTGVEDNYLEIDASGRFVSGHSENVAAASLVGSNTLEIDTKGMSSLIVYTTGVFTGSIGFEGSLDYGVTWIAGLIAYDLASSNGTIAIAITTAPSLYRLTVSGFNRFRLNCAAITGTAVVKMATTDGATLLDGTTGYIYSISNTRDGSGSLITSTTDGGKQALDVHVANTAAISVSAAQSGTWNVTNVSGTVSLPTGASTSANQTTELTRIGDVTEAAPATDTASSGLNGRLQRAAQRLTSLIALIPASLGQKAMSASLAVTVASDQSAIPASQSGTWTVQPGNTANTTAWKVDGSAVTQPVSNAGTFAVQAAQSGTWNVTNVSGTVSLPTGASTETTLAKLTQTQGSTTSGQSGPLAQAAVTTAAPSYTTAQTSPLSLTTAGGLRTDTSSVAGTTISTGNGVTGAGTQRVTISSDNTAFSTKAATGTLTNRSGTTSGTPSTSTQIMASNSTRQYLFIQNVGATTIWINFTTAAVTTQPSIQLSSGANFIMESSFVSTEAVNVISTGTSIAFAAKEA